ncbi:MAG TPA: hypothetical protein VFJ05_02055 [Nitrososphaeraceae archaeon]|nr:hypothetical protein [Nitrososphaeraceae archaeon]
MNNTTAIRTLAEIVVVVVVLVFTLGSLAPSSSSTPLSAVFAYQNKGTQDNGNGNSNGYTLTGQASMQVAARESGFDNGLEQESQSAICTHQGNNATCSQEGIIPTTTQIPPPTPQQPQPQAPAALAIIKHVIDDIVGTISAKDFSIDASGTNVSRQSSFPGAQSPSVTTTTAVTLKPGTFPVALLQKANTATITAVADHDKCSSSSSGGDIITCTHNKETHHSAKDIATPFVLPIPFP